MTEADRRIPLTTAVSDTTAAPPAPNDKNRRWSDRPGRTPARTFARLLTTSPGLDEVVRCLVGLLSWPVGATGAVIVRDQDGVRTILARYEEPFDPSLEVLRGRESEPCISDIVAATGALSPVIWTEPDHESCRPMGAWPLESSNGHVDHLVIIFGEPEPSGIVADRMFGIPEVLAVYLAGREPGSIGPVATESDASGTSVHLSGRQARVLEMMAQDLTMQQIASRIGFSDSTVRMESLAIYRALGVHDRRHAVDAARAMGMLSQDEPGITG
jgi:DNA-binding CsgD family transcriptional regulator